MITVLRRQQMGEVYRTLLGHFRHEVGHHYWDILVRDGGKLQECRLIFGDDTEPYDKALARHYEKGPQGTGMPITFQLMPQLTLGKILQKRGRITSISWMH